MKHVHLRSCCCLFPAVMWHVTHRMSVISFCCHLPVQTHLSQLARWGRNVCYEEQVSASTLWQPSPQSNSQHFSGWQEFLFLKKNIFCWIKMVHSFFLFSKIFHMVFFNLTSKVVWVVSPFINTAQRDERSREICCPCIVCLRSPSKKNVGTQRESILIQVSSFVTFTEWYWVSLTFDLAYTLFV